MVTSELLGKTDITLRGEDLVMDKHPYKEGGWDRGI